MERPPGSSSCGPESDGEAAGDGQVRLVGARSLLGERGLLRIEHRGEIYTLRITRNDRLILTK